MPEVWNSQTLKREKLPPLSGAAQEANEISGFFKVNALTGPLASEKIVKERIENAHIIHLATHGLLEYGDPTITGKQDMPGAIALASGAGQDGLLTASEIATELNLQADLVVLSACDTGRGEITGDGVAGLSRALMTSGATGVVVSLWAVPDAPTADLMVNFYKHLSSGKANAQSLRQAMLTTMETHQHPKDWAAFVLMGEAQQRE